MTSREYNIPDFQYIAAAMSGNANLLPDIGYAGVLS